MLKPAQLYKEELNKKYIETWYNPKYIYYYTHGCEELDIPNNNYDKHCYACIDNNNEITGYFNYSVDWKAKSIYSIGLMSFIDNNTILIRDVIKHIKYMFENCNISRLEFWSYTDNPANRSYNRLVAKYGGRQVGVLKQNNMTSDGQLRDTVIYEILRGD